MKNVEKIETPQEVKPYIVEVTKTFFIPVKAESLLEAEGVVRDMDDSELEDATKGTEYTWVVYEDNISW